MFPKMNSVLFACTITIYLMLSVFLKQSNSVSAPAPAFSDYDPSDKFGPGAGGGESEENNFIDNPWGIPTTNVRKSNRFTMDGPSRLDNRVRLEEFLKPRAKCDRRIRITNGVTRVRDKGTLVRFQCSYGFHMLGAGVAVCVRGQWSDPPPSCVREGCRSMPIPLHGSLRQLYGGGVAVFSCNYGFLLDGERILTCDGQKWNGTAPTCTEIPPITIAPPITTYSPPQPEPYPGTGTPVPTEPFDPSVTPAADYSSTSTSTTFAPDVADTVENNETTPSPTENTTQPIADNSNTDIDSDSNTIEGPEITTSPQTTTTTTDVVTQSPDTTTPTQTSTSELDETTTAMTDKINEETTSRNYMTTEMTATEQTVSSTTTPMTTTLTPEDTTPISDPEVSTIPEVTTTMTTETMFPTPPFKMYTKKPKPTKPGGKTSKGQTLGTKKPTKDSFFTKRPIKIEPTTMTTVPPEPEPTTPISYPSMPSLPELGEPDTEKPTAIVYTDPTIRPKMTKPTSTTTDRNDIDDDELQKFEKVEIIPEKLGNHEDFENSSRYDFGHLLIVVGITLIAIGLVTIAGGVLTYYWRKNKGIARPNQYDLDGRTLSSHDGNDEFMWLDNRDSRDSGL